MTNVPAAQYLRYPPNVRSIQSTVKSGPRPSGQIAALGRPRTSNPPLCGVKPGVFVLSTFPSVCVAQLRCWLLLAGTAILWALTSEYRPSLCTEAGFYARLQKKKSSLKAAHRSLAICG